VFRGIASANLPGCIEFSVERIGRRQGEAIMPDQNQTQYQESDPRHHTQKLKKMLSDTAAHAREDVAKISDPKAQALFGGAAGAGESV